MPTSMNFSYRCNIHSKGFIGVMISSWFESSRDKSGSAQWAIMSGNLQEIGLVELIDDGLSSFSVSIPHMFGVSPAYKKWFKPELEIVSRLLQASLCHVAFGRLFHIPLRPVQAMQDIYIGVRILFLRLCLYRRAPFCRVPPRLVRSLSAVIEVGDMFLGN